MKRVTVWIVLTAAFSPLLFSVPLPSVARANVQVELPAPDESSLLGRSLPNVPLDDEWDQKTTLTEAASGKTVLFVPIYTHCRYACPLAVTHLKKEALRLKNGTYKVILFTFDPTDSIKDMRDFRQSLFLPEDWKIFRATAEDTFRILEALDFHTMSEGRDFAHPDIVAVLSPDLTVKGVLRGTAYSDGDLLSAVKRTLPTTSATSPFSSGSVLVVGLLFLGALSYWGKSENRRLNPRGDNKSQPVERKSH